MRMKWLILLFISHNSIIVNANFASCLGNSVCGFLQANSKGVSKIPYCNCSTVECPLNWDPFDGKSVTQSVSDQYKYCEESPSELPTCSLEDEGPSYTSVQYYDKWTREKMLLKDDIRCLCPEKYNYLDTRYKFMAKGHYDIVVTNYYCLPLMDCNPGEICKEITDLPGEFLVNPKCLCPLEMSCPTLDPQNVETIIFDDHTLVHNVRCEMTSRVSKMRNLGELLVDHHDKILKKERRMNYF